MSDDYSASSYNNSAWSPFRAIWRPTPDANASASTSNYYKFFGRAAGRKGKGYYSYNLGTWHVVVLNSNCSAVGCGERSKQLRWLKRDLRRNGSKCTLAYWHRPLFSSSAQSSAARGKTVRPFWRELHKAGAEAVINGEDMMYERFEPQDARGRLSRKRGVRQFVVGTGGQGHGSVGAVARNSGARVTDQYGVLRLRLEDGVYSWLFVSQDRGQILDNGRTRCH